MGITRTIILTILASASSIFGVDAEISGKPEDSFSECKELLLYGDFDSCPTSGLNAELKEWTGCGLGKGNELPENIHSSLSVDNTGGRNGGKAMKMTGTGETGIVEHVPQRAIPGTFKVSGWIKCKDIGNAKARIGIFCQKKNSERKELFSSDKYVTGSTNWTHIENTFTLPQDTAWIQMCLLADSPHNGIIWWDDLSLTALFQKAESKLVPPAFQIVAPKNSDSDLLLKFNQLDDNIVRVMIYCEEKTFCSIEDLTPAAILDDCFKNLEHTLGDLKSGETYYIAAIGVDFGGNRSPLSQVTKAAVQDKKAPGLPEISIMPIISGDPEKRSCRLKIKDYFLDDDIVSYDIFLKQNDKLEKLKNVPAGIREFTITIPAKTTHIYIRSTDKAGNCCKWKAVQVPDEKKGKMTEAEGKTVSGTISSSTGKKIEGAKISLFKNGILVQSGKTENGGRFLFNIKQEGLYTVMPEAEGFLASAPQYILVNDYPSTVDFVLWPRREAPWTLWVENSLSNIFKDKTQPVNPTKNIKLTAMANEQESCQLVMRTNRKVKGVRIRFGNLFNDDGAMISKDNFTYNFVGYIPLKRNSGFNQKNPKVELLRIAPADFPDPLSDDTECDIEENTTQSIYITFSAPAGTKPGNYRGRLFLQTMSGDESVDVAFEVWPLTFPASTRLWVNNWAQLWENLITRSGIKMESPERWKMTKKVQRMMRKHHQNSSIVAHAGNFIWTTEAEGLIKVYKKENGETICDFRKFDKFVQLCIDNGVGEQLHLSHWAKRESRNWTCQFKLYDIPARMLKNGEISSAKANAVLTAIQAHIKEKGWIKRFLTYIADEPVPSNVEKYKEIADLLYKAAPALPHIEAIQTGVKRDLDISVPQLDFYDRWKEIKKENKDEWWFYVACVPQGEYANRFIDMQCIKARIKHWIGYRYDAKGYLHAHLFQSYINNRVFSEAPGDETLIWKGRNFPISSIRYEAERDGIEDVEYMYMLEDAVKDAACKLGVKNIEPNMRSKEIVASVVRSFRDYTKNYECLNNARQQIAQEIIDTPKTPLILSTCTPSSIEPVRENQMIKVEGYCENGSKITINGRPVIVHNNHFITEQQVNRENPAIMIRGEKNTRIKEISRNYSFINKNVADAVNGKNITCMKLKQRPVIDGNIEADMAWEKIPHVSGFLKLGTNEPASKQTFLRVGYTAKALYIAMTCKEPEMEKLKAKLKDMEELWKEDSVEAYISVDDKYYTLFIVNSEASRFIANCFENTWKAAVEKGKDYWSVEMEIPFETIGRLTPSDGDSWQINFCRNSFVPGAQASTWSYLPIKYQDLKNFGYIVFKTD